MKKIFGISIFMLLITLVLPTSIANVESLTTSGDDVEINISTGFSGKDIGLGFAIDMLNHKTEDVTVFFNVTFDYLFMNDLDFSHGWTETVPAEMPYSFHLSSFVCAPDGIKFVSITAEAEDTKVTRSGLSIRRIVILF